MSSTANSTSTETPSYFSQISSWFGKNDSLGKATIVAGAGIFAYTTYKIITKWRVPRVTHLIIYPVKGFKGIEVQELELTERGFQHDRKWMVVQRKKDAPQDEVLPFVTQRHFPKMALMHTELVPLHGDQKGLTLWYINKDGERVEHTVSKLNTTDKRKVTIWFNDFDAYDEGDEVAEFLTGFFNEGKKEEKQTHEFRLVRSLEDKSFGRTAPPDAVEHLSRDTVAVDVDFADAFPFLLLSQQSVNDFSKHVGKTKIDYRRFRPNIVVSSDSLKPFEEDYWKTITIGGIEFHNVKTCTRCTVPSIDPNTGERDLSVAAALQKYRGGVMFDKDVTLFGVNMCSSGVGNSIKVGNLVEVVQRFDKLDYDPPRPKSEE